MPKAVALIIVDLHREYATVTSTQDVIDNLLELPSET